jgi:hypothetical protein
MKLGINEPFDSDDDDFHFEESPTKVKDTKKLSDPPVNLDTETTATPQAQHAQQPLPQPHAIENPSDTQLQNTQNSSGTDNATTTTISTATTATTIPNTTIPTAEHPNEHSNSLEKANNNTNIANNTHKSVDTTDADNKNNSNALVTDPTTNTTTHVDSSTVPNEKDSHKSTAPLTQSEEHTDMEDLEMKYLNALMQAAPVKK